MKYFIIALATLFCSEVFGQTLLITDPIQVADNSMYGKTRPRIAINRSGEPVVMWSRSSTNQVYISTKNFGSQSFNTPVKVTPDGIEAFVANWAGPDVASFGDTVFVTYHSTPEATGKSYVHRSIDGGLSFGDSVRVDHPTVDQSRFPTVAVTDQGNPVVGFMKFEGNWLDPQYTVANSNDQGMSFQPDVVASELAPGEVCDCCPAQVATGSAGFQSIAYRNNDNNLRDNWVSISSDNGSTFPNALDVDDANWVVNSCPSSGPDAFFFGDTLYTVWMSEGSGETRIYCASVSAQDGGIGYSGLVRNQPFDGFTENFVRIAGDNENMGVVYQAWNMGETDSYLITSESGITGFSDTIRLGAVQDGAQRYPDIAFHNGVYHIVYDDSEAGHLMYQTAYYANVGVEELTSDSRLWCSGNGQMQVELESDERFIIQLINSLGQVIRETNVIRSATLSDLPSGILNVRMISPNGISSKSVLIF